MLRPVDHAGCTAPTREHELDHTKIRNIPTYLEIYLDYEAGMIYLICQMSTMQECF